ncbi:hypothetical protein [Leucobacter sp. OH1287]|uniref:hypothetical protein n=1 Tax=Leucobacter sp. OH1287 TaxID=2491049 RepID=UPI000F5DA9E5|nr:hypothetical protein [Leucobacter sp. OH1287]RRD61633.1 hypothetical protein EII30_02055 [Leucobacter sp. OH1287]
MRFNSSVYRWRRPLLPDPYNPDRKRRGSWHDAEIDEIPGAFIGSGSMVDARSPERLQSITEKSLFLDNPAADVVKGDGISVAPGGRLPDFEVRVAPVADVNPFTGWQPVREMPLDEVTG